MHTNCKNTILLSLQKSLKSTVFSTDPFNVGKVHRKFFDQLFLIFLLHVFYKTKICASIWGVRKSLRQDDIFLKKDILKRKSRFQEKFEREGDMNHP